MKKWRVLNKGIEGEFSGGDSGKRGGDRGSLGRLCIVYK